MNSRTILIAIISLLIVVVCVGLFFLFSGSHSSTTPTPISTSTLPSTGTQSNPVSGGTGNGGAGNGTGQGSLPQVTTATSNESVLDYFVNATNTITAVEPNGTVVQISNGQASPLSSIVMQNIVSVGFSYNGAKILVNFGDPANPQTSVFDVTAKTWTALPAGLQSPVWSPSDTRIAYLIPNAGPGVETVATLDAAKPKTAPTKLITLHVQDLALSWPLKNQLALFTKPSISVAGSLWTYDLTKAAITPMVTEVPGLSALWSGAGFIGQAPMALEFSGGAFGFGGSLSLLDATGNTVQRLKLVTLPSKCVFMAKTATSTPYLFCGVPRDQDTLSASHLPDDYNEMALYTSDNFYRVNLQNGAIDTIFNDATKNFDVSDVKLINNSLYFINRYDKKLYQIGLMTM